MTKMRERLEFLKKTDPRFKDFEIKSYRNDLRELGPYIDKLLSGEFDESINEENKENFNESDNSSKESCE